MPIRIHMGNVLEAPAQALLVAVSPDSIADIRPGEGADRILGNVARQFRRRWPSAWDSVVRSLWDAQNEGELNLFRPGGAQFIELDEPGCPFAGLEMISSLSHDIDADLRSLAILALRRGLAELFSLGIVDVATTLPKGGWRLDIDAALQTLIEAFLGALKSIPKEDRLSVEVGVWVEDEVTREKLTQRLHARR